MPHATPLHGPFTTQEIGALFIAFGQCMVDGELTPGAVVDGGSAEYIQQLLIESGVDDNKAAVLSTVNHDQLHLLLENWQPSYSEAGWIWSEKAN